MPAGNRKIGESYTPLYALELFFVLLNIYYYAYGFFAQIHFTSSVSDALLDDFVLMDFFVSQYTLKWYTLGIMLLSNMLRHEEYTKMKWVYIIAVFLAGVLLFLTPYGKGPVEYMATTLAGFFLTHCGLSLIVRKTSGADPDLNDEDETFDQNRKKANTQYAINIPMVYQYKKRKHKGVIAVPVPFAGCAVMGLPGSGKSYSIYTPFIEQMIAHGYCLYVYDYKFPELTIQTYNEYLLHKQDYINAYGKEPQFCVVNYNDPRYSMRVNPIHPRYIKNPTDATEISDLIMKNVNPASKNSSGGDSFWDNSAKLYIDAIIYRLKTEQGGRYCTFPHFIEMLGRDYKMVFQWLEMDEETKVKTQFFSDVLHGGAMETLQSQIASARAPLMRFASKDLYWVLSGDDIDLNINDPDCPKILCVGNDPKKQTIFGTTNSLITMRLFTQINTPKRLPTGVLLDEFPTMFVDALDNLMATARSRLIAVVIGIQDFEQLVLRYGREYANSIWNLISNIFAGRVNGDTSKKISDIAGKEYKEQKSHTKSDGGGGSTSTSQHLMELLPNSKIMNLSQGFFAGKVADGAVGKAKAVVIKKKVFCGKVLVDAEHFAAVTYNGKQLEDIGRQLMEQKDQFGLKIVDAEAKAQPKETTLEYLEEQIRQKENEEYLKDASFQFSEPSYVSRKALQMYDEMTDEQKDSTLAKAIDELEQKHVQKVLRDNYYRIKQDINDIFTANGISDTEEGSAVEEEEDDGTD